MVLLLIYSVDLSDILISFYQVLSIAYKNAVIHPTLQY